MMADCNLLMELLKKEEPEIMTHFEELNYIIYLNNILIKWLISLFVETVEYETFLTIWDCMLLDGNIILFKAAIALLNLNKKKLLSAKSVEEISALLDDIIQVDSQEKLRKILLERKFSFEIEDIITKRDKFIPDVESNVQRMKKNKEDKDKIDVKKYEEKTKCCKDWNFCNKSINSEKCPKVLTLRTYNGIEYIEKNFYSDSINKKINECLQSKLKQKNYRALFVSQKELKPVLNFEKYIDLLIERKTHKEYCKNGNFSEKDNYVETTSKTGGKLFVKEGKNKKETKGKNDYFENEIKKINFNLMDGNDNPFDDTENFDFDFHPEYQNNDAV